MTDDVKTLIDDARAELSVGDEQTFDHATAVDDLCDWVRGEASRTAAAVAAATKEFRDKQALWDEDASFYLQTLRQADRIAELEAEIFRGSGGFEKLTRSLYAERDALRAQLAAETNLYTASMAEASRAIEGLTAQVEAARAEAVKGFGDYSEGTPEAIVRILDGAKP